MACGRVLVPLLTAGALAALPAPAFAIPRRGRDRNTVARDEDVLQRPLKVFTFYDHNFSRIAKVWRDCLTKALPMPLAHMSVEAKELSKKGLALVQTSARAPSQNFSHLLLKEWAAKLATADTLHIDADAFLLKDPARGMPVQHPEADIIASVDCVREGQLCAWYRRPEYLKRHQGQDPLADRGFMLNTGFMYLRSSRATMRLLNNALVLTSAGENEQVAMNEVLLGLGCTWKTASGSEAPRGRKALQHLATGALHGVCKPGVGTARQPEPDLRVVVLPYSVVPRSHDESSQRGGVGPQSLAFHPDGKIADKERMLGRVRKMCKI